MIQRRSRFRLKPIRLIRWQSYPCQPDKSTSEVQPRNSDNDNSLRPMRGCQVNDGDAAQWAVIWPG